MAGSAGAEAILRALPQNLGSDHTVPRARARAAPARVSEPSHFGGLGRALGGCRGTAIHTPSKKVIHPLYVYHYTALYPFMMQL